MNYFTSIVAAVTVGSASACYAAPTLGTVAGSGLGFPVGYAIYDPTANFVIAQSFTLNASTPLASIAVYLHGNGTPGSQDTFKFELTRDIGPAATAADLLLTRTGTFPTTPTREDHAAVSFATPVTLAAGKYYIVLSSTAGLGCGWGMDGEVLPSAIGAVGDGYIGFGLGGVMDYHSPTQNNINLSYTNFLITAVPEPIIMSCLPAVVSVLRRQRRD